MKKTIGGILLAIGILVVLGSIGNDDYGTLYPSEATCTLAQNLLHAAGGAALIGIGALCLKVRNRHSR